MERTGTIAQGDNCLIIKLAGDQTYLQIFDASGGLLRESRTNDAFDLEHMAEPGDYRVETDGTIEDIRSEYIDLPIDAAVGAGEG